MKSDLRTSIFHCKSSKHSSQTFRLTKKISKEEDKKKKKKIHLRIIFNVDNDPMQNLLHKLGEGGLIIEVGGFQLWNWLTIVRNYKSLTWDFWGPFNPIFSLLYIHPQQILYVLDWMIIFISCKPEKWKVLQILDLIKACNHSMYNTASVLSCQIPCAPQRWIHLLHGAPKDFQLDHTSLLIRIIAKH